uniref:Uncharacterized protein n=1 Tax=Anguilla anguilla TaxID=7936 RepID=A0A0E9SCE6_ANGAN
MAKECFRNVLLRFEEAVLVGKITFICLKLWEEICNQTKTFIGHYVRSFMDPTAKSLVIH